SSVLFSLHLFFDLCRYAEGSEQLVIAGFAKIKTVTFSILVRKISPRIIYTEHSFPGASAGSRNLPATFVADNLFYLFRFFQLILAHTISSCKIQIFLLSRLY